MSVLERARARNTQSRNHPCPAQVDFTAHLDGSDTANDADEVKKTPTVTDVHVLGEKIAVVGTYRGDVKGKSGYHHPFIALFQESPTLTPVPAPPAPAPGGGKKKKKKKKKKKTGGKKGKKKASKGKKKASKKKGGKKI